MTHPNWTNPTFWTRIERECRRTEQERIVMEQARAIADKPFAPVPTANQWPAMIHQIKRAAGRDR